ncbi:DUF2721 domain-containing protein [Treponema sp.]
MNFNISTPALLFSAISLLLLAYTNRFLAIASIVRQFIQIYNTNPTEDVLKQISHFKTRLKLIKYTQIFGVLSFIFCVFCMFLIMLNFTMLSELLFSISLVILILSLLTSLVEISISINALDIELDKINFKSTKE